MAGSNLHAQGSTSTLFIRETDYDGQGLAVSATCSGTPPTTASVFAHGCLMRQYDTATGSSALFENIGSSATPVWSAIGSGLTQTISITSAQLKALFTTPISLVAAPGAGKFVEFVSADIRYIYGATAYTINGSTNLNFTYTDGSGVASAVALATTGFIDQTSDQYRIIRPTTTNITPATNAALVFSLATANPTLGDGTLSITYRYRIVTL